MNNQQLARRLPGQDRPMFANRDQLASMSPGVVRDRAAEAIHDSLNTMKSRLSIYKDFRDEAASTASSASKLRGALQRSMKSVTTYMDDVGHHVEGVDDLLGRMKDVSRGLHAQIHSELDARTVAEYTNNLNRAMVTLEDQLKEWREDHDHGAALPIELPPYWDIITSRRPGAWEDAVKMMVGNEAKRTKKA